jgi:hypothetical protein
MLGGQHEQRQEDTVAKDQQRPAESALPHASLILDHQG